MSSLSNATVPKRPESISVFVVDDEHVIATTVAMILKTSGFNAKAFFEPREALQAALLAAPDLLISDVVMPGMSGIDLAIEIQKNCPNCSVLLFSGQAATAELLGAANQAGHNFKLLSKPIHPTDLLAAIRHIENVSA